MGKESLSHWIKRRDREAKLWGLDTIALCGYLFLCSKHYGPFVMISSVIGITAAGIGMTVSTYDWERKFNKVLITASNMRDAQKQFAAPEFSSKEIFERACEYIENQQKGCNEG